MTKNEERKKKMDHLAKLYGYEHGTITKCACRGKWRGTYDYSVDFGNGESKYLSNGMTNFDLALDYEIESLEYMIQKKDFLMEKLREIKKRDDLLATKMNLTPYEIMDVDFTKRGFMKGAGYLVLSLNQKETTLLETSLSYALRGDEAYWNKTERPYFVAGGLLEKNVDFVFNGVGFSSAVDMYKAEITS